MKASAEKSSTAASTSATPAARHPFFAPSVQAKLTLGKRDDLLEREADAVADRVVNRAGGGQRPGGGQAPFQGASPLQEKVADWEEKEKLRRQSWAGSTPDLQRQEEVPAEPEVKLEVETPPVEREEPVQAKSMQGAKDEEPLQAKRAERAVLVLTPAMKSRLAETKGEGSPLPPPARAFMEAGFGIDFGQVRIHTGRSAAQLSNELQAVAFTHGSDIYFHQGKYSATTDGQKLLAHELTHVVQQNRSRGVPLKPAHRKLVGKLALEPVEPIAAPVAPPAHPSAAPAGSRAPAAAAVPPAPAPAARPAPQPELKETAKGLPPEKEGAPGGEKGIEPARAPAKPQEDADFQQAKKEIRKDARRQKSHELPGKKQSEMTAAAALTAGEQREQSAQEQKAAALEKAAHPKQKFDRFLFKEKLKAKIEEKLPDTEDAAKAFPGSGKLDQAKSEFGATVSEEKGKLTDPLKVTAEAPPPPGQVSKTESPVPPAKPAAKPSRIPAQLAAPKPRTDREISLQEKSDDLDRRLEQEKISEPQLAESEEPLFEKALAKKQDAQREIANAPARYREQEAEVLGKAQQQTGQNTGRRLQGMATVKNRSLGGVGVRGSQVRKESQTEIRQREIKNTINGIYTRTEGAVHTVLKNLAVAVQIKFDIAAQLANMIFNRSVRSRLDDHYGWFTFDDKIAEAVGLSDGVAHIFREEKQNFLNTMDKVLDEIATMVESELNRALQRIQQGRDELEGYKKTLTTEERQFADDLIKEVEDKFTDLESSVEEQQEELLETLSDLYVENVNKLQEEFDKINEELGSSWIADAINFIGEVASAIRKLGALLRSIVERIAGLVDEILAAPKRFFANLVSGINQGIDKFTSNIGTYLEQGFWMWLTGASSARNIQVPEKMDPKGMFSLALQMIGIDRAFVLERIRVKLGAGVEKVLTRAEAAGEKLLEPVRILLRGGIGALWDWVKEEVSSRLQEIFTKIKQEIFEAIIKKALIWVASLFIPGLGFIRLVQAIYKALRWLVDNIDRIVDLVNSFLDSIALAVQGNVGGIVNKVIKGLTLGVVIAIDFLAKLVGLGNFADKLQRAIQSLKKPIQKGIDWLLTKARPVVRKIERALRKAVEAAKRKGKAAAAAGKKAVGAVLRFFGIKKYFSTNTGERHALFFEKRGGQTVLLIESTAQDIRKFMDFYVSERKLDANKMQLVSQILSHLESYKDEYAELKKVGETSEKAKPVHERLLQKNVALGELLRTLLSGDRKVGMLIESYLLEGLTGTYSSMPRPPMDILTPDHQPQAAIIKWAADLKGPVSRRRVYSSSSDMANRAGGSHASGGYAINLHEYRHTAGRTFGSEGEKTKNGFINFIKPKIAGEADDQKIRNIITARMKQELGWDVAAMRTVITVDKNYADIDEITDLDKTERQKLKGDIKIQITKGLRQIENQPMDTLKDY
ncbi:MAG: hypothetical protein A2075_00180 [Geobacteraceae bacterium GWC2_58_44]|nr:MAG: hypothetical protein A2075_00180 [Geobacteraceae bacterium GWC2_58_44]HBG06523.1 hypothetical protein [Geobacter sp.]